jgi:glycosyltransferase involved in cell wall biosynthesis
MSERSVPSKKSTKTATQKISAKTTSAKNNAVQRPFFSVVIPALNEEKYIGKLLKDLSKQTFSDFEVCVADGKSEDSTQRIVQKWQKIMPALHLAESSKRHVSVQRNLGAKQTTGKYLLFLDADDRIPPFFLEGIHYQMMKRSIQMWTCWIDPDVLNPSTLFQTKVYNMFTEMTVLINNPFILGACIGIDRKLFNQLHGFDETLHFMEDADLARRADKSGILISALRDPTYTFCLRRIRKEGSIKMLVNTLPHSLKALFGEIDFRKAVEEYPMIGGTYFSEDTGKKHKQSKILRVFLKEKNEFKRKIEELLRG